jgi:hypothetical protein
MCVYLYVCVYTCAVVALHEQRQGVYAGNRMDGTMVDRSSLSPPPLAHCCGAVHTLLQCVALHVYVLQCDASCCSMLVDRSSLSLLIRAHRRGTVHTLLQCVAVCVLQCVAMCCSVLFDRSGMSPPPLDHRRRAVHVLLQCVAVFVSVLQCVG